MLHKPQSFRGRPWEYRKTDSIDAMDALGSNIRVDARGREVIRILPRINEAVNEEWIGDKTRQVVDGLKAQRLDRPYLRQGGRLVPVSWPQAFAAVAEKVRVAMPARLGAVAGDLATAEEMFALKAMMASLGSANVDCRQDGTALHPRHGRASYLFNATVAGIERATSLVLVGANPRREAPVLNARIRKRWLRGGFAVSVIGQAVDLTYPAKLLGAGFETLAAYADDKPGDRPMLILGQGALCGEGGAAVLKAAAAAAARLGGEAGWTTFNVLHTAAARVGGLDLGLVPSAGGLDAKAMAAGGLDVLFNLGADEIEVAPGAFVVYLGTHGDRGAHRADVILPGAAYTEKAGIFVNTEGRVQEAARAGFPPGDARDDWSILRALSDMIGHRLPFDSFSELRAAMVAAHPHLGRMNTIEVAAPLAEIVASGEGKRAPFGVAVPDYYLTNPIARASRVMAECSALAQGRHLQAAE